jgi:hypothetical protein
MPMTVKQIADAQLAGAGEKANVRTLLPASLSVFGRD